MERIISCNIIEENNKVKKTALHGEKIVCQTQHDGY